MTKHLFVYGTLMSGLRASLESNAALNFKGNDTIQGDMFDVGYYPGVKLGGDGIVQGEVYEILSEEVIPALDRYEGYHSDSPEHSLYLREVRRTGSGIETYVYEYNQDVSNLTPVRDGDWRKHRSN